MFLGLLRKLTLDHHTVLFPVVVIIDVHPEFIGVLVAYGPLIKLKLGVFCPYFLQRTPGLVASPVQPTMTHTPVGMKRVPRHHAGIRRPIFFLGKQSPAGVPTT